MRLRLIANTRKACKAWYDVTRQYMEPGADYQFELGMLAVIIMRELPLDN